MDRREFIRTIGFGAAALALPGCSIGTFGHSSGVPTKKNPNFLFILADDLGWSQLGCYGSGFYETPNIGRLAG